jgi:hypothetical protein
LLARFLFCPIGDKVKDFVGHINDEIFLTNVQIGCYPLMLFRATGDGFP